MVCTGEHTKRWIPSIPGMEDFQGQVIHTNSFKDAASYADKTVVVIGLGNSSVDVCTELASLTNQVSAM